MDYPDDIIKKIIYQIYESDIINRKFFKEHILEIMSSNFNNYQISYWNTMDVDPEILKILTEKYGYSRYDVRGIKIYATK